MPFQTILLIQKPIGNLQLIQGIYKMGKSILIITLGVSLIIGFIILKINTNATYGVEATMNKFDQTHARLIANSSIEIYLEKLFQDESLIDKNFSGNLMGGTYNLRIDGPYNNAKVTSTANFLGVNHTSIVEVKLVKPQPLTVHSALYFATPSLSGVKNLGNGTLRIDGKNYYMNTNPGVKNPPLLNPSQSGVPGITVENAAAKTYLTTSFGGFLNSNVLGVVGGANVFGADAITVTSDIFDWKTYVEQLISAAKPENTYNSIKTVPNTLGTLDNPQITLINEPDLNKTVKINSNITGAGIMIVNGNVAFNGNLVYNGLIICYRDTKLEFTLEGGAFIFGSMIAAGEQVEFKGAGTANVYYSSEAINDIVNELVAFGFQVTSWWE
jgi:hypothetical protein